MNRVEGTIVAVRRLEKMRGEDYRLSRAGCYVRANSVLNTYM